MSYYPHFGVLLNQYLMKIDRSPAWLARRLGLNDSTVSRWLNDGGRPGTPETVGRIADILGNSAQREKLLVAAGYGYQASNVDYEVQTVVVASSAAETQTTEAQTTVSPPRSAVPLLAPIPSQPPTHFVGRTRELAALTAALAQAQAGNGQIRFVIGEAGQGKSALVQEFAQQAQSAGANLLVIGGYCNAHRGIGDPYLPFRQALALLGGGVEANWADGGISPSDAGSLGRALSFTLPALVEYGPDLIEVFIPGQPLLDRAAAIASPTDAWFKRLETLVTAKQGAPLDGKLLFAQYKAVLKAVASQQPLLLIVEDLHWLDTSSAGLLFHLCQSIGDSRILLIGTYRPDEVMLDQGDARHPLLEMISELKRRYGDIWLDLADLTVSEGRYFVDAYLDTQPNRLDETFRAALFRRTQGHALFTVELLRDMQERGNLRQDERGNWIVGETLSWQTLPTKVEGVIEKRFHRLDASAQAILRIASIEGETFTAEIVARIQQIDERSVVEQLSAGIGRRHQLVTMQALEWVDRQRLSRYRFCHYLFQQYVYQTLDTTERAYLHEAVGTALEAIYGEQVAQVAVQLAHHFVQAGMTEKAVGALLLAGKRAHKLAAHREAIQHLTQGLDLLRMLPETQQRARYELNLQLALGSALTITGEIGELERTYYRAYDLCQQLGEMTQLWPTVLGLSSFYCDRGEYQRARTLLERLLTHHQGQPDVETRLTVHMNLALVLHALGDFIASRSHLEKTLALYDPQQHRDLTFYLGFDPRIASLGYLAADLWLLGYPDQARQCCQEMLAIATEVAYPNGLAMAAHLSAWLYQLCRDGQKASTQAIACLRTATEHHFPFWLNHALIDEGWTWIEQGNLEAGIARIQQGMANLRQTNLTLAQGYFSILLAKGYAALGESQVGLKTIASALAIVEQNSERWYEAELYRLQGELMRLQGSHADEAEHCFWQAIELARHQQAKSWELRATVSLCRLWQDQGKQKQASTVLTEIVGWFTEGFEMPDLLEATTLLALLSQHSTEP